MHPSLNPIQKHKSEIQKRISQLQHKFNKDRIVQSNVPGRKLRQQVTDQNKYNNTVSFSKTMEVKGRNRGVGEIARLKKNIPQETHMNLYHDALRQNKITKNIEEKQQRDHKQHKQQKIKELQFMVRSLLEGQKVLEKELNDLKTKNTKDQANKTKTFDQSTNHYQPPISFINSIQKTNKTEKNKDSSICKKRSSVNPMNHSLLIAESNSNNNNDKGASKQKKGTKKSSNIQSKKKDFQQLYQQLKQKGRQDKRYIVQQQWKSRIWNQVQSRVRQSDKQYKDTMHRNNKHQFQHLMSTYELQRKLKDDLIDKVYQQCNDQIYK